MHEQSKDPEASADLQTDYADDEDTAASPLSLLVILALGGFSIGILMMGLSWASLVAIERQLGDSAWIVLPSPMLIFGAASLWQYEWVWLQRLGAAAIGFALGMYIMLALALQTM